MGQIRSNTWKSSHSQLLSIYVQVFIVIQITVISLINQYARVKIALDVINYFIFSCIFNCMYFSSCKLDIFSITPNWFFYITMLWIRSIHCLLLTKIKDCWKLGAKQSHLITEKFGKQCFKKKLWSYRVRLSWQYYISLYITGIEGEVSGTGPEYFTSFINKTSGYISCDEKTVIEMKMKTTA